MDGEDAQELRATLVFSRLPDFGPGRYWQLLERFGSCQAALQAAPSELTPLLSEEALQSIRAFQNNLFQHPLSDQIDRELAWLAGNQVKLLSVHDRDYPTLLRNTHLAPPLLYVEGELSNLALPQLAMVGSRHPSPSGKTNAFEFSRQLAHSGFAITSGLALGVDGAAHRGALAAGGKTIAVLGTGIDRIYPHRHRQLWEQILAEGGTVVSEFPLGTGPHATHFPRRNRIISGMSLGVLVVEAAIKSGSLITARYAMQQGREVFAIPGSIHNPMARGCHQLLREGATLVERLEDLKEPLQGLLAFKWAEVAETATREEPELSGDEQRVLQAIGYENTTLDAIMAASGLEAGRVLSLLTQLELQGLIQQTPGGYQRDATALPS